MKTETDTILVDDGSVSLEERKVAGVDWGGSNKRQEVGEDGHVSISSAQGGKVVAMKFGTGTTPAAKKSPTMGETVLGTAGKVIKTWKKIADTTLPLIDETLEFKKNPTILGGTRMAMRLHGHVSNLVEQYSGKKQVIITYENDAEWQIAFNSAGLNKQLWNPMVGMEHKLRQLFPENDKYFEMKLDGHLFGIVNARTDVHLVYYSKGNKSAQEYLSEVFWKQFGTVMVVGKNEKGDDWLASRYDLNQSFETDLSKQYTREILAYRAKGYTRSLLFYGPPGTGKTNTAAQILSQCASRTLILSKPTEMNIQWFQTNFPVLQPEAVLIEDIDHFDGSIPHLLAIIEYLNKNGVLVLATCNKIAVLDDALIRAGRFDEVVEVLRLPPEVICQMLGGDEEICARVVDFPIAAILDLRRRMEVLGRDEALNRISDLEKRVKRSNSKKEYKLEEEPPK